MAFLDPSVLPNGNLLVPGVHAGEGMLNDGLVEVGPHDTGVKGELYATWSAYLSGLGAQAITGEES